MKKLLLQLLNNANGNYYSLLSHFPKKIRVGLELDKKIPSSIRVAGTRWGLDGMGGDQIEGRGSDRIHLRPLLGLEHLVVLLNVPVSGK